MKYNSIEDVISFIEKWTGQVFLNSTQSHLPSFMPDALHTLDKALGGFWERPPFPFEPGELNHNSKRGLFYVQDEIVNPRTVDINANMIPLVLENQGVFCFGYSQELELMITGDWSFNGRHVSMDGWEPFPADIEDVLSCFLLSNFFTYIQANNNFISIEECDEFLEQCPIVLWSHSAMGESWEVLTDNSAKMLLIGGLGAIVRG